MSCYLIKTNLETKYECKFIQEVDLYWLSLYELNRKIIIKWSAVNATQLSCIEVKHILKDYFLNNYF